MTATCSGWNCRWSEDFDNPAAVEDADHPVCTNCCRECGCLTDDHQNHAELLADDDPLVLLQIANGGTPLNYCGDCAECARPRDGVGYVD